MTSDGFPHICRGWQVNGQDTKAKCLWLFKTLVLRKRSLDRGNHYGVSEKPDTREFPRMTPAMTLNNIGDGA